VNEQDRKTEIGMRCPNATCGDTGTIAVGSNAEGWEPEQCEFCYTEPLSVFNIRNALATARDEQREKDAQICDEVASEYSGGTFNDCSREVRAAEDCAAAIRR
jgi:hypothetical protein